MQEFMHLFHRDCYSIASSLNTQLSPLRHRLLAKPRISTLNSLPPSAHGVRGVAEGDFEVGDFVAHLVAPFLHRVNVLFGAFKSRLHGFHLQAQSVAFGLEGANSLESRRFIRRGWSRR